MTDPKAELELINQVVARPDEDASRLAYADWLDAHGRSSRAELIHIQCQAERLHAREAALLAAHSAEWGEPLRQLGAADWQFRRGFPEDIRIETTAYVNDHAAIRALTPVTRLRLTRPTDANLGAFAGLTDNRSLTALEVGAGEGRFGPAGVRALSQSPHLAGLRELRLHSDELGPDGVYHVCQAPFIRNLTYLTLDDMHLTTTDRAFRSVIEAVDPDVIRELRFGDKTLGPRSPLFDLLHPRRDNPSPGAGR